MPLQRCLPLVNGGQIADQRPARFPVTFALHAVLLMEHNLCCVETAPYLGYEGDEVCQNVATVVVNRVTSANQYHALSRVMLG